jgi:hypothetical protein
VRRMAGGPGIRRTRSQRHSTREQHNANDGGKPHRYARTRQANAKHHALLFAGEVGLAAAQSACRLAIAP